jgi:hypothetical protein
MLIARAIPILGLVLAFCQALGFVETGNGFAFFGALIWPWLSLATWNIYRATPATRPEEG